MSMQDVKKLLRIEQSILCHTTKDLWLSWWSTMSL
ncbi:hypothetical protein Pint_22859 [Pistacia integerrima]|uniref:Uncharacterized protein n=1 Tax=Pistacia integerrima TaxID=434235 RepID=A0ACC0YM65_9ROSI|nr:hypothetical protein Pint_22859 [Pistacia integerrima]